MSLTKEEIIVTATEKIGFSKSQSRNHIEQLLEIMKRTLSVEEDVLVSGFGKFVVRRKGPRRGRNPQTSQDLQLKARKVVTFKPSGVLRKVIDPNWR
jgi:integration host factor subunit alpha